MKKAKQANSITEFDTRFDRGDDIHDLIDISRAIVIHHGKKVRITMDIAQSLVKEIDKIGKQIGIDPDALIKIWLYERIKKERTL
ncbi:MAG: CopG family transcriptional regulator [Cytophagales bacterium]|nr:CopG family transcriptional regulator [Cytophagales bacterium]